MRALPSGIFKILCSRRTMCNPIKTTHKVANGTVSQKLTSEMSEVISLVKKYPPPIPWDQITKSLVQYNNDFKKMILRSFSVLKDADTVISFCKFIFEKGENFDQVDLFIIVKTLSFYPPEKIIENEELLVDLFNECKESMWASEMFQIHGVQLFSYIPRCYRELIPLVKNSEICKKVDLICRAFDFDDSSTAWELLEGLNFLPVAVLESFTNYCIRQAFQNKFSISTIQALVDLCHRKNFHFDSSSIICTLQPLVQVLMHCQDEYIWSVKKCIVNDQMECLNCNTFLNEVKISESEFKILKNAVIKTLIPKNDIFLKTSNSEIRNFKIFLSNCRPYDIVVDGLNLFYCTTFGSRKGLLEYSLTNYVRQMKKTLLIILRKHSKRSKFFKKIPDAQFFYTDDSSDDDVFLLYAAMHGGLGTCILSSDFLVTHAAKLDSEIKPLFIRWQHYHQYAINRKNCAIVPPSYHLGLPQCTESIEGGGDSYKWHLSHQENETSKYRFCMNYDWACLQAVPKKKVEKNYRNLSKPLITNAKAICSSEIKATK